ncbi:hypothetical protein [Streptomyces purpurascens]|uniref:hypothetical protein n=1 Tax=Streptomyces purpurascens TaxID=1924 RepID=UPI001676FFBA|nr:hypothetical protein [Streptomyces purpurascens]MCE7051903.1 hypothetical protein [Streptomyces purpurascens]GHA59181.1 hypothetical protein GCM10010303_83530 [Streptomyces purpurascens]
MAEKNNCSQLDGLARQYCEQDTTDPPGGGGGGGGAGGGITDGATGRVEDLANILIKKIDSLLAPRDAWAPDKADSGLYEPFLWLGQHLAVAIFVCVVVVCALTAWQGAPRLKQMGASTGWALVAVACMASVPGVVMLLNKAVSAAFTAAFDSDEGTLFGAIREDVTNAADPLAKLLILSALVVALAFAALVFMTRQLGILAFVCIAPLVLASLARGGDMTAVKAWAQRLLGLMFAPFALLLVSPFVQLAKGSLVVDTVLLVAADALMLRMIFHGVPYFGPKVAGAARALVERNTTVPLARAAVRVGAPTVYEQENAPKVPRTVDTPGRAMSQDRGVLFAAYGLKPHQRSGRLTTESAVASATREETDREARAGQIRQARRQARASVQPTAPAPSPTPAPTPRPAPVRPDNT